ncbi:MAG: heavy metal translocating P-type ATPase [Pseudomonadota bacterium]
MTLANTELTTVGAVEKGCPSGLEPASASDVGVCVDPSPFVIAKDGVNRLDLAVHGVKCAGCISKIEKAMTVIDGMDSARQNLSTGRLSLEWRAAAVRPLDIVQRLAALGYRAAPFDPANAAADADAEGRSLLRALAVAGFATANVMLLSVSVWAGADEMGSATRDLMHWLSAVIAVPAALYAGRPFFASAWGSLRAGRANMDVPISLAVILALSVSLYEFFESGAHAYFDAAVMLLFFLLIGRYLDHRLRQRARAAARQLLAMQATTANRLNTDGTLQAVAARDVKVGDLILLSPGDTAPTDAVVETGESLVNAGLVTGESAPVSLKEGDVLHAGVLNVSAPLKVRATRCADDSLVAELTRLVEAGEQSKDRYVRLADRAAALYVPVVHSLAAATFLGWFFLADAGMRVAIMNAVAVLIITCPCALGLAAPAVQVVATGRLFRKGILVKSGDALERLAEADAMIFDKTGTLTYGAPRLVAADALDPAVLAAAASLARVSRHPLSRAIVAAAGAGTAAIDAHEEPGFGVKGTINGVPARLGKAAWLGVSEEDVSAGEVDAAGAVTWFVLGDAAPVRLAFDDAPRRDARDVLGRIKERGLTVEVLSGDRPLAARRLSEALGVDQWIGGATPQDKMRHIQERAVSGAKVAMVGDGLNDAPSLAGAHVSLSPGTAADASQAAADFVYQGEGLAPIIEAIDVSLAARRRVLENFGFAALYNACAIPLAVFGFVTPLIAALAMSGSSMVVTLNALRLAGGGSSKSDSSEPIAASVPVSAPAGS